MQTLVIGDIHGCPEELQALLEKAGLGEQDDVVSLGDCVDRGPGSPAVLQHFIDSPRARLIMGNHERKHLRCSRHELRLGRSQQISILQFGDAYPAALEFMSKLPLYLELPEALLLHGFLEPGVAPGDQKPSVICGTKGGEKYLRRLSERPWYELYEGQKPVIVGHQNYTGSDQPFVHAGRVFGLDTECVKGKALTGLLLPSFRFVSVRSRADHWAQVRRDASNALRPALRTPIPWEQPELRRLEDLVGQVRRLSGSILSALEAEPGYEGLSPRARALRFGERAQGGRLGMLLQLARLGRLEPGLARKLLARPQNLDALRDALQARGE